MQAYEFIVSEDMYHKALKAKGMLQWRFQDVEDSKTVEYLPKRAADMG